MAAARVTTSGDWTTSRSLHPELRLRVHAPMADVLASLDRHLRTSGFRIADRQPSGFRARFVNWWALFLNNVERTVVVVSATEADGSTEAVLGVASGAVHPRAAARAARAVHTTVQELRERHVTVTSTDWEPR